MSPELMLAATRGPQVEDMQTVAARGMTLANLMQNRQLNQMQKQREQIGLQEDQMKLQEQRRQFAEQAAQRKAWMDSGGDPKKYRQALMGISPAAVSAYDAAELKHREELAKIGKAELENRATRNDALRGSLMAFEAQPDAVKQDSKAWQQFIFNHAKAGDINEDDFKAMPTTYPGSNWIKLHANDLALGSQLMKEEMDRRTVEAQEKNAATNAARLDAEKTGIEAENFDKQLKNAANTLAPVTNQSEYDAWRKNLPSEKLQNWVPAMFSRAGKEAVMVAAMGPAEAARIKREADSAAEQRRHNLAGEGLDRQKFNATLGAGLDANGQPMAPDALKAMAEKDPVVQAIANYQMKPPMTRNGMPAPILQRVLAVNPNYDATQFEKRNRITQDFAASGKSGKLITSADTALAHLDAIDQAGKALKNNDIQAINRIASALGVQTGKSAPAVYDTIVSMVSPEISKAVIGEAGGEGERQAMAKNFSRNASDSQRTGAIASAANLLGARIHKQAQAYEYDMGKPLDLEKRLSKESLGVLSRYQQNKAGASAPAIGTVMDGYRFKGGNPADPKNWEKI